MCYGTRVSMLGQHSAAMCISVCTCVFQSSLCFGLAVSFAYWCVLLCNFSV